MRVAGLVPSVRPQLLRALLQSWWACPDVGIDELYIHAQRGTQHEWAQLQREFEGLPLAWAFYSQGLPVWPLRVRGVLDQPQVDVWVQLDDDMEFIPGRTNYAEAIERALQPGVGVVSCNWVRSESPGFMARALRSPTLWVRQPIVNMSGGMVYARALVPVLAETATTPWLFDDTQVGLSAYLAGYENWRYRGSIAIHRILSTGGMKVLKAGTPHVLPDARWLRSRRSVETSCPIDAHNLYIPVSSDLTPEAHARHLDARRKMGKLEEHHG